MDANPGPIDGSVLYDQDKHVSVAVWEGQERGALRCHEHTSKLGEWRLNPKQIELVEKAGFGYLRKIPAISLDNPLISALVERWRRETNTFHLTVGEMTVTLQDVALLLGLAIDGKPVIGITHTTCSSVCERLLGQAPDSTYASGGMVKLSWLKEFFSQCPEDAPAEEVERCTRAYLLYLVGSTIFSTTTGNKVPVMYLPLFENLEESGRYAWGAAALAFLYRALGNACVKSQSTICGCLTLLQCWSHFHLNIGRPKLNRDPIHDHFPFVLRWKGKQSGPTTNRDVVFYRKALDSLKPHDVEWLPYKYMDSTVIPEDIKGTLVLGRSKTMLICFDKAERHLPDRCLRQYGMFQPIPEDVERWVRKSRGVDGGVDLSGKMELELNEWMDRRLHIVNGDDGVDESEYMQWYFKITRKVVGRPISLSSEFQRTISGLREISHLADSFSMKGLDTSQFESISRIRFIAQDCLRDQAVTGSPVTVASSPTQQIELGKRTRGKERVRRKGTGKRRRKDDSMEYQEASENDQSQFYGAVIEADELELHQAPDGMVGQLHLVEADVEVETEQLFLAAGEDDGAELPDVVKADDAQLHDAIKDSKDSQPCHTTHEIKDIQVCVTSMEVDDFKHNDTTTGVNDSQLTQATNEAGDSQSSNVKNQVNDTQLGDVTVNDQLHDKTYEIKDSQLHDVTVEVNGSRLPQETNEVNDSQLLCSNKEAMEGATKETKVATNEAMEGHLPAATKEALAGQIPAATKEAMEGQIPAATKEAKEGQLPEATKEAKQAPLPPAMKEGKQGQLPVVTKEAEEGQLPAAMKEAKEGQLPTSTKEAKEGQLPAATKEAKEGQLPAATKEAEEDQLPAATKEAEEDQLPVATKEAEEGQLRAATKEAEEGQLLAATKEAMDLDLPQTSKVAINSLLPHITEEADDSPLQNAIEEVTDVLPPPPIATKDSDVVLLQNETIEINGSQIPKATKEGNDAQLPHSTKEENDWQLPDSNDAVKESQPPEVTKEVIDSKCSHMDVLVSSSETAEMENAAK